LEAGGFFDTTISAASERLGVGITTLKKVCRAAGLRRWPYRTRSSLARMVARAGVAAGGAQERRQQQQQQQQKREHREEEEEEPGGGASQRRGRGRPPKGAAAAAPTSPRPPPVAVAAAIFAPAAAADSLACALPAKKRGVTLGSGPE